MKYLLPTLMVITGVLIVVLMQILVSNSLQVAQEYTPNTLATIATFDDGATIQTGSTPVTLVVAGDMMFDRAIRDRANDAGTYNHILRNTSPLLHKADIAMANLEGPISTNISVSKPGDFYDPSHYQFTFAPIVATALKSAGIDIVSLDNNHSTNFGRNGIEQTKKFLRDAGLFAFGDPYAEEDYSTTLGVNGQLVSFVSYNEFGIHDAASTIREIETLRSSVDWIVVMPHWGNEYEKYPRADQVSAAHSFIDAGADFVLGAHSHVIGMDELYKGKPIYYSLGNFVFDQWFNEEVRCGLALEIELSPDGNYSMQSHGTYLEKDGTTTLSDCFQS